MTNPAASGYKTSEFTGTVAGIITVLGLFLGVSGASDHLVVDALAQLVTTAVAGVFAMITIGTIILQYIKGRRDIKLLLIQQGLVPADTTPTVTQVVTPTVDQQPITTPTDTTVLGDGSVAPAA